MPLLLQERFDALPRSTRICGHKDGSGLTLADLPWLISNGFATISNKYRCIAGVPSDESLKDKDRSQYRRIHSPYLIEGVPEAVYNKLPTSR